MPQVLASILEQVRPTTLLDIGITALLIYWLFSLIRGTSAVRLVIGVSVLFVVYFLAQALSLRLLTQILQAGAVVGLFALVVVFQPELRRALDRIGSVGSLGWLLSAETREVDQVAADVARAAALLSAEGHGALIVLERETGLEEIAETGVMIHGDLSVDLLRTIFTPKSALHDGAVIVRSTRVLAAGAVLPLAETTVQPERFGTRHRAALGITEQTDAVVVVVSEENGQISLVQRARIVRNLNEAQLARAIRGQLHPGGDRGRIRAAAASIPARSAPRLTSLARLGRANRGPGAATAGGDGAPPRAPSGTTAASSALTVEPGPTPATPAVTPTATPAVTPTAAPAVTPPPGMDSGPDPRLGVRLSSSAAKIRSPDFGPRDEAAARSAGTRQ